MSDGRGFDKRKAWFFLFLIAIAILCIIVLIYTLTYANPHTAPTIKNGGHTLLRQVKPGSTVHS
jgi:hypothetical protein